MVNGREEADDTRQERRAHEADNDASSPHPGSVRNAKPPVGEGIRETGERADTRQHERDRAGAAYGVVERLSLGAERLRQRFRSQDAEHGDDSCGHEQPQSPTRNGKHDDRGHGECDAAALALRSQPETRHGRRSAQRERADREMHVLPRRQREGGPEGDECQRRLAVPVRDREVQAAVEVQELRIALLAQPHGRPDGERAEAEDDDDRCSQPIRRSAERYERREEADGVEEGQQAVVACE